MGLDPELMKQLIATFKTELEEQLQVITVGLLHLEKGISNEDEWNKTIEAIFRSAHNIKGASRSLNITNVGEIAHKIETLFSSIQKKSLEITPQIIDVCLNAIDKMQLAMTSFIDNTPLSYDLNHVLNQLSSPLTDVSTREFENNDTMTYLLENKHEKSKEIVDNETSHYQKLETKETVHSVEKKPSDSIRISVNKIEKISALMEEMQVNKIAIDDHYLEIMRLEKNIKKFHENWHNIFLTLKSIPKSDTNDNSQKYLHAADMMINIKNMVGQIAKNLHFRSNELSMLSNLLQDEIHTLRLIPVANFLCTMPRYIRDLSHELNKKIELVIKGDDVKIDKMVLEQLKDPIIHILRNCADHGIELPADRLLNNKPETGIIHIDIREESNHIVISISDDGYGMDVNLIKKMAVNKRIVSQESLSLMTENEILELVFMPGFSTKDIITSISGRGVGLDVVKENIGNLNGNVSIHTELTKGTTFELKVPLTLASEKGLLINCSNQAFVIPTNYVERVLVINANDVFNIEGVQAVIIAGITVPLHTLVDILNLEQKQLPNKNRLSIIILKKGNNTIALLVDEIMGERDIVLKPFQPPLITVNCVAGGTLSGNNQIIIVLNTSDIIQRALHLGKVRRISFQGEKSQAAEKIRILVVDDSITTRTLEKNILESKNYDVTVAVNGKEAWDLLQKEKFSLMVTDVTMPIMDGFTLTEQVKQSTQLQSMPVIIVTSLGSNEEKKRGVTVGADAYLIKNEFESGKLLEIVDQLV